MKQLVHGLTAKSAVVFEGDGKAVLYTGMTAVWDKHPSVRYSTINLIRADRTTQETSEVSHGMSTRLLEIHA